MKRCRPFVSVVLSALLGLSWSSADAGSVEKLPIEGMLKITAEDGSVKYLSENRRFVFVGTMYDLWQGNAMSADIAVSDRLDLARNGVSIEKISIPLGEEFADETLFIAPECEDCKALLSAALKLEQTPINVVLLASTEGGNTQNAIVWCAKDRRSVLMDVYLNNQKPKPSAINKECDRFGLMLAEQAAMLFGIGQLPLFLDADGIGHTGENAVRALLK